MGTISKNFSYKEFEESETAERKGIANVINTTEIRDSVKALVLNVLQPLRDAWGKPLHINSGYRCPALNEAVGGVPTSAICMAKQLTWLATTLTNSQVLRRNSICRTTR